MTHKGFSHIGLSTLDLDKTRDFYENIRVELCIFHLLCNELDVVGRSGGTPPPDQSEVARRPALRRLSFFKSAEFHQRAQRSFDENRQRLSSTRA
jgi:catechol 2,3-dioxygenase-like lactoylglutathione lyase family enzyme